MICDVQCKELMRAWCTAVSGCVGTLVSVWVVALPHLSACADSWRHATNKCWKSSTASAGAVVLNFSPVAFVVNGAAAAVGFC